MRPTYSFPEPVVEEIADARYRHPDPRVQERMGLLRLKSKNETHGRIAELANVSRSTVQRTLRVYAAKGLDGIRRSAGRANPAPWPRTERRSKTRSANIRRTRPMKPRGGSRN